MIGSPEHLRAVLADIRTMPLKPDSPAGARTQTPFVTLSREPGAGAVTLGSLLVDALNRVLPATDEATPPWAGWDRDVVEQVARETGVGRDVIESIEERNRNWLNDFFGGLSTDDHGAGLDSDALFRRIASTIRALAQRGRAVIVGCGGVLLTQRLPAGVHVRLVAPLNFRIMRLSESLHLAPDKAAHRLADLDRNRQAFFKRFWPNEPLKPEHFALTINTERVTSSLAVEMIISLVREVMRGESR
jgi:cytidylate kinase